ncbi:MAG: AsmA family protein [Paucibacter sp.]|nr:AsmA family protein [Roseateles sp.]
MHTDPSQAAVKPQPEPPPAKSRRSWPGLAIFSIVGLGALLAIGESMAWPWLAAPLQRSLTQLLGRDVSFDQPTPAQNKGFRLHLLGGVRIESGRVQIAAPAWSAAPFLARADEVLIELRYADLWRAYRGQPLRIQTLQAATLDAHLLRGQDGRASWLLGRAGNATTAAPQFELLRIQQGTLHYRDALTGFDTLLALSLADAGKLRVSAKGSYRTLPLQADMTADGVLPWINASTDTKPVPLSLNASVGRAELKLNGSALDALRLRGLKGSFSLSGTSLAAVGDPLGLTLPTTAAFRAQGALQQNGTVWEIQVDQARIGATVLTAALKFEPARQVPLLTGRLGGSRLALADLGPVLGTTPATAAPAVTPVAATVAAAASAPAILSPLPGAALPVSTRGQGRLLPNRPFDLAALRKMDADVLIAIDEVDANTTLLAPLRPLRARLRLTQGVLSLQELETRMGGGRLSGNLQLDGRATQARWSTTLNWQGVQLEQWLRLQRKAGEPPFVTGYLNGHAKLAGEGRSTAEILASLSGRMRTELKDGTVSHLVIEAAGLDLAESLGLLIKGDEPLAVHCAVADLQVRAGVLSPKLMVVDTDDSTVFLEGTVSLDQETIALQAIVSPKDFSPLTLRSPVHLQGSFAEPEVTLEKGKLGIKLAGAVLLGLLNPVAALLPLLDLGDLEAASQDRDGCEARVKARVKSKTKPGP